MWFKSNFTIPAIAAISFCIIGGTSITPAHAQDCGNVELTQNLSLEIEEFGGIACQSAGITVENSFARCYMPSEESFSVHCIDLGIEINTGSDLSAAVNIYIDIDGCPPTHPDLDLILGEREEKRRKGDKYAL